MIIRKCVKQIKENSRHFLKINIHPKWTYSMKIHTFNRYKKTKKHKDPKQWFWLFLAITCQKMDFYGPKPYGNRLKILKIFFFDTVVKNFGLGLGLRSDYCQNSRKWPSSLNLKNTIKFLLMFCMCIHFVAHQQKKCSTSDSGHFWS